MRIRIFTFFCVILWTTSAWGQIPIVRAADAIIRGGTRAAATQAVRRIPSVSVVGYFHREGNMEFWEPSQVSVPALERKVVAATRRPLESLRLEAHALGMPDYNVKSYSREQLEEWINSYRAFKRAEQTSVADEIKNHLILVFDEKNYIENWEEYAQNVHPNVPAPRVLVVHDDVVKKELLDRFAGGDDRMYDIMKKHFSRNKAISPLFDNPDIPGEWEYVTRVSEALKKISQSEKPYDIILTDFVLLGDETGFDLAQWVYDQHISTPVILFSQNGGDAESLFARHIVGRVEVPDSLRSVQQLFNYLTNVIATGHAYP